jgi:hypothetical protein
MYAAQAQLADFSMTHFGEHQAGVCLAGEYTLERFLSTADDTGGEGAFFEARSTTGKPVLLKLADAANPEERLFLWRRTAHLQHPNLLQLIDSGMTEDHIYAAFEWPDDILATALDQGPLEEKDARDFLAAALDALRYLHAQGLVHGSIDAAHVVAIGNTVKLSTDNLREPEGDFTYAGDIGALGALLYHVLTGWTFDGRVDNIAEPFAAIVRNTAGVPPDDRWRIPEIVAAMGPAPEPEVLPEPEPAAAVASVEAPPAPPEPVIRTAPAPVSETILAQATGPHIPRWAWPASVALIAACFAWVFHTPAPKDTPEPIPAAAPAPLPSPQRAPVPQRAPAAIPQRPPEPPPTERAAVPQERSVWRVIAYTYHALRDAEARAVAINRQWPGIHAEVFAPKGRNNPPYLVALGGRMDRMSAARVLQRARTRGLPRDTFMLNFAE